jgi:hypothetical protein
VGTGIAELSRILTVASNARDADNVTGVVEQPQSALDAGGVVRIFTGNAAAESGHGLFHTLLRNDGWLTGIVPGGDDLTQGPLSGADYRNQVSEVMKAGL